MTQNDVYAGAVKRKGNTLFYDGAPRGYKLPLTSSQWRFLGHADILQDCSRVPSIEFRPLPSGDLMANVGGISVVVTPFTLITFHEIFIEELYPNFRS
jgi:hypothetical protein